MHFTFICAIFLKKKTMIANALLLFFRKYKKVLYGSYSAEDCCALRSCFSVYIKHAIWLFMFLSLDLASYTTYKLFVLRCIYWKPEKSFYKSNKCKESVMRIFLYGTKSKQKKNRLYQMENCRAYLLSSFLAYVLIPHWIKPFS